MQDFFFAERGIAFRKNEFVIGRPTLVFIHGLSGSSSAWFPFEERFATSYNLLTFDLRGHGKSHKPTMPSEYELRSSADDLYALVTHLSIPKFVLISHSYGTLVALEFLRTHQDLVSATVFLSPTSFLKKTLWFYPTRTLGRILVDLFSVFPFHPIIRGRVDYTHHKNSGDWNLRRIRSDIRMTTVRIYVYCLTNAYETDYDDRWKELRIPVLIMHGTKDSVIPAANSVALAKEIPGSTLVLLKGANHMIVLNNVPEVAEQIQNFISR
jgi:pimeloyl-ACP methyl ester carboxylesterase